MVKKRLVVLSGAGISAESGLKTFRDSDGLWEGYDIQEVATPGAWRRNPSLVLDFYNQRRKDVRDAQPNAAHYGLAALEKNFDVHIITQNIDDLHERAGSTRILHLHGEILKMRSEKDQHILFDIESDILVGDLSPDGAQFRPHVVWFGEEVPAIEQAIPLVNEAEIFVVVGTSLAVYPAAGLVQYARSHVPIFIIDKKIPGSFTMHNLTRIEKPATAGIADLTQILLEKHL